MILTGNNPILRKVSTDIHDVSAFHRSLAKDMTKEMIAHNGCGLAAPQLGENIRMIVITRRQKNNKEYVQFGKAIVMINPIMKPTKIDMREDEEGCLSIEGIRGRVKRYSNIDVDYIDLYGNTKKLSLAGLDAAIVQHEIDHLDGILFTDRAISVYPYP